MDREEAKMRVNACRELGKDYADASNLAMTTAGSVGSTRNLWRSQNKPVLIKVGLALIAFPDPTVSDVVGGMLVAAGMVQAGIQRRSIHVEDVPKALQKTLNEIRAAKLSF
jgi:hypothetical protein